MTSALSKRLDRLEALLAARINTPIVRWMDADVDPEVELERMVADGEIAERDLGRVTVIRWLSREESIARGEEQPPPPEPDTSPRQLPAPPELKLLPAPPAPIIEHATHVAKPEVDPDYERVRVIPPKPLKKDFHDAVEYPRTGDGI